MHDRPSKKLPHFPLFPFSKNGRSKMANDSFSAVILDGMTASIVTANTATMWEKKSE